MPVYKNTAGQETYVYAVNVATGEPETGDAANITAYISKDGGASAQTNDVNPTEVDATNQKGTYRFDLSQAETNANIAILTANSSTSNIQIHPVSISTTIPAAGAGATTFTYTVTNSVGGLPIADVKVWVSTDIAGTNIIADETTNASGQVVFYLDGVTLYFWSQKTGWNFTNPDTETVATGSGSTTGTAAAGAGGTYGWVTEGEADTYFDTRLNAASVWVVGIKPQALQTAYNNLIGCGYFTFPDTATDAMKEMQYEQALMLLLADPDVRLALQAQGIVRANVVGETYQDREQPNVAIAPLAWTLGEKAGLLDRKAAFIRDLSRTEDTESIDQ